MLGTTGGKNAPEDERIEPEKNDGLSLLQMFFNEFFLDSRGPCSQVNQPFFSSRLITPNGGHDFFPFSKVTNKTTQKGHSEGHLVRIYAFF